MELSANGKISRGVRFLSAPSARWVFAARDDILGQLPKKWRN
jgi:hypothetical protein